MCLIHELFSRDFLFMDFTDLENRFVFYPKA